MQEGHAGSGLARQEVHLRPSLRKLKRTAIMSFRRTGLDRAIGVSGWRRQRLLILAYHGVSLDDEHLWNGALYMAQDVLEERLRLLRAARCTVLPLAEAVQRLYDGTLDERSVALTFDDGYFDFVERAHPLLHAYGLPATVYLRTHLVGQHTPIYQLICAYLFWKARRPRVCVPELRPEPFDIGSPAARAAAVRAITIETKRKGIRPTEREGLLGAMARDLGVDYHSIREKRLFELMSEEDVRRLAAVGIDFQLHTHSHNAPREEQGFRREIDTNRDHIRRLTGREPVHYCYPSGQHDPIYLPWLASLGVRSATTCDPGLASPKSPPLMLPRLVDTSSTTADEFRSWLTGTGAWLSRRRTYARRPA